LLVVILYQMKWLYSHDLVSRALLEEASCYREAEVGITLE